MLQLVEMLRDIISQKESDVEKNSGRYSFVISRVLSNKTNFLTIPVLSTLKMTAAEAVKTSVPNSLSQDRPNMDDLTSTRSDSPRLKPFSLKRNFLFIGSLTLWWKTLIKSIMYDLNNLHIDFNNLSQKII